MKTLLGILALAGAVMLGNTATERMMGSNLALAQARPNSACFENCAYVRRWPASQCIQYCKGKTKRR